MIDWMMNYLTSKRWFVRFWNRYIAKHVGYALSMSHGAVFSTMQRYADQTNKIVYLLIRKDGTGYSVTRTEPHHTEDYRAFYPRQEGK